MLAAPEVCQDDCVSNPSIPGTISAFLQAKSQVPLQCDGLWGAQLPLRTHLAQWK